ncbi:MAG TPA: hypothetical protein DEB46_06965 [Myxococcales bacterium]|nr:hypothetical protein [Myxococcales bacterium]
MLVENLTSKAPVGLRCFERSLRGRFALLIRSTAFWGSGHFGRANGTRLEDPLVACPANKNEHADPEQAQNDLLHR